MKYSVFTSLYVLTGEIRQEVVYLCIFRGLFIHSSIASLATPTPYGDYY